MTNYFENCKTSEELKATYKELVKKYHPDVFGEKGNDILKDVHNQLEKATRNIDKKYYSDFNNSDRNETAEMRARKEQIAKELYEQHKGLAYQYLFFTYWSMGLKPANHRNPETKHNFSGWNVWQLELQMLLKGYTSCEWATFAQLKTAKNSVKKGEHGTYITLAIIAKSNKEDEDTNEEQKAPRVYYKGYSVFNMEQTNNGAKPEVKPEPIQIAQVKAIETQKEEPAQVVICRMHSVDLQTGVTTHDYDLVADKENNVVKVQAEEPKQQTLWESVAVVA